MTREELRLNSYLKTKDSFKNYGFDLISDYKEYRETDQKLTIKDKYNYLYYVSIYNLKANIKNGISFRKVGKENPYSINNIELWAKENSKNFILLDREYRSNKEKLKWKCKKCNETFYLSWNAVDVGQGCPFCSGRQVGVSNCVASRYPDLVKEWHPTKNNDITPYNVSHGSKRKIWWKCEKGHEWQVSLLARTYGKNGCPYCSGLYPSKEYNLLIVNPKLSLDWDYFKNDKSPDNYVPCSGANVWWLCPNCNHSWKAFIKHRHSMNIGCPNCNKFLGEEKIEIFLKNNNIEYIIQHKFKKCKYKSFLKFDFYIPSYGCIEYNGIQHYEIIKHFGGEDGFKIRQVRDQIKRDFCNLNNIMLLEIPYWDFDNIEQILSKKLNIPYSEVVNKYDAN